MGGGNKSDQTLSSTGPSVVDVQVQPKTFELDPGWQPTEPAKIVAQVKDFTAKVTEVRLRFSRVPLQVPMRHVGGTTWEATLSPSQLQTLAVGGKTMEYEANLIARNEDGLITVNPAPIEIAVKAPVPREQQAKSQAGEASK